MAGVQCLNLYLNLIQWCSELGLSSLLLVKLIIQYVCTVCQHISDTLLFIQPHVAFQKPCIFSLGFHIIILVFWHMFTLVELLDNLICCLCVAFSPLVFNEWDGFRSLYHCMTDDIMFFLKQLVLYYTLRDEITKNE